MTLTFRTSPEKTKKIHLVSDKCLGASWLWFRVMSVCVCLYLCVYMYVRVYIYSCVPYITRQNLVIRIIEPSSSIPEAPSTHLRRLPGPLSPAHVRSPCITIHVPYIIYFRSVRRPCSSVRGP